jgi:thioredoxin 1
MKKYTLLKYSASWCRPCSLLKKVMYEINQSLFDNFEIKEIDIDEPDTHPFHNVYSIPTLIIVDNSNGKEVKRKVGLMKKEELEDFLTKDL